MYEKALAEEEILQLQSQEDGDSDNEMVQTQESMSINIESMPFCARMKVLLHPIHSTEAKYDASGDAETTIVLSPEAFRIWFYIGIILIFMVAAILSLLFADVNLEDNLILNTLGANSICVYIDDPPASYVSTLLYLPCLFTILLYEFLDTMRVYDRYLDKDGNVVISKQFYDIYLAVSVFECVGFCSLIICLAVTPYENMYLHTIPYELFSYGIWSMTLKKFVYFKKTGLFDKYHSVINCGFWLYVFLLLLSIAFKSFTVWTTLFGVKLWKIYPAIATLTSINLRLLVFLILFVPMFYYFIFAKDCKLVTLKINRSKK